jgi:hypothetical protein
MSYKAKYKASPRILASSFVMILMFFFIGYVFCYSSKKKKKYWKVQYFFSINHPISLKKSMTHVKNKPHPDWMGNISFLLRVLVAPLQSQHTNLKKKMGFFHKAIYFFSSKS